MANKSSSTTIDPVFTQPDEGSPRIHVQGGFLWDRQDAYLFDIDGTLLRSRDRIHYESFFESVRSVMGRELVLDGVTLSGNTDPGILYDAFRLAELDDEHWQPMLADVLAHMRATVAAQRDQMDLVKMPGVDEILAYLYGKSAALGIGTGNLESIGWLKLEVLGVRRWFTFGGFADNFPARADMIADAARQARSIKGADASVCVVGDTPFDIRAARANGLPTIAVATGRYSFNDLMQDQPEVCASTLAALMNV
ncbi:HAD family hydrolase [Alloacidobacterium sp.]|uniref:HAD family hydrolase n=1 Tax=Alloacidobacterium sp. TaxID=2951999 RepID=UPI002D5958DF|nr:HAD hydrolase-like protein [Alloacidobacterium sp.]HYK34592.1 HAD hydrolase-like protein [Alloacidobacterium sp.]